MGRHKDCRIQRKQQGSATIIADGNMEADNTDSWDALYNAVLTKQTTSPYRGTRCLRITKGDDNALARQNVTIGKTYRITGWARGDGTARAAIGAGGSGSFTSSAGGTEWEHFDFISIPGYSYIYFLVNGGTVGNYIEIDDVRVEEVL